MSHASSIVPWTNMSDPLSATISPYVFIAWKMRCTSVGYPEMSTLALSRSRAPRGGAEGFEPAECEAGQTCPFVARVVTRKACRMGSKMAQLKEHLMDCQMG